MKAYDRASVWLPPLSRVCVTLVLRALSLVCFGRGEGLPFTEYLSWQVTATRYSAHSREGRVIDEGTELGRGEAEISTQNFGCL